MNRYDGIVDLVENHFDIVADCASVIPMQRPYDDHLITLKFSTASHEAYLIKEFQHLSPDHLQVIFSALEKIRGHKPSLSFPLPTNNGLYYFTDAQGCNFQLLKFLNLAHFDTKTISLQQLFKYLKKLHLNLSHCQIPVNQYSDLKAYIALGLRRIRSRYGDDLPLLPKLELAIEPLPIDSFRQGVRHGDIQETNVCFAGGEIVFIDCDTVHFGYPLMDYVQGAAMYLDQDKLNSPKNQTIVAELWQHIRTETPNITPQTIRYLLARVVLGPIQGGDIQPSKEDLTRFLIELEGFYEGNG